MHRKMENLYIFQMHRWRRLWRDENDNRFHFQNGEIPNDGDVIFLLFEELETGMWNWDLQCYENGEIRVPEGNRIIAWAHTDNPRVRPPSADTEA